ncbi:MAG TPA: ABC transporter permease [Acidobacteriota bacterium]|nr:ABC transporter permease [Acidobacteriota bacterium]
MNKTLIVARREYLSTVRRRGFVIATIGMPLFFVLLYGIIGIVTYFTVRQEQEKAETVGIVDEGGLIKSDLLAKLAGSDVENTMEEQVKTMLQNRGGQQLKKLAGRIQLKTFKSREDATAALVMKQIRCYYIIPSDFLRTGVIRLEIKKGGLMSDNEPGWNSVRRLVVASLVDGKLDEALALRVSIPPKLDSEIVSDTGQPDKGGKFSQISGFAVPYAFMLFFMMAIMGSGGYLLQGVAEEKENRVIEILLSSVTTDQLLAGKVIGLCGAGLTQIAAWISIIVAPAALVFPFLDLRWSQLVVAVIFFLLGFLLFGTLMGGTGALGNNLKESQQSSIVWTMSSIIPVFFVHILLSEPNGTFARVLSYIPLTAPITVMLRVGATRVPWWDITLSAVIIFASLFVFVRLAAKLFRMGTLMYGKRPTLMEIIRWLRAS